jgi:bacterioferritin-associated ferredoxin
MIICVCRRISDREIVRLARAGMDFDDLQIELGLAAQCGQCEGRARDVLGQCKLKCDITQSSPHSFTPTKLAVAQGASEC